MKRYLILLFTLLSVWGCAQTNATFNKLDVRGTSHLRGAVDIDTTLHLHGLKSQIIAMNSQMMLILDSATENVYHLRLVDFFDSIGVYVPNYWTFVDSGTDTLKNNVAVGGRLRLNGNVYTDYNYDMPTTTASLGQIKQNGSTLLHTYHEKGNNNVFLGYNSGNFTADSSFNTAVGNNTLPDLTLGTQNTAIGSYALSTAKATSRNTAIGYNAIKNIDNTVSIVNSANTAVGYSALQMSATASANTGYSNVAVGASPLYSLSSGNQNTAIGNLALYTTSIGNDNVGIGYTSLRNNVEGISNTAIGTGSLYNNGDNDGSTAVGYFAMYYADSRTASERVTYNTAVGYEAMRGSTTAANNTGTNNTALGYQALDAMTTGDSNTVVGVSSGGGITTGDRNVLLGWSAGSQLTTEDDKLFIENSNSATPLIWGDFAADSLRWNAHVAFVKDLWYEDRYWRDATVSGTALAPGVNAPSLRTVVGGILQYGYAPSTQNDISYGQAQINHDFALDSNLSAHMHFMLEETAEPGDTAVFQFEYSWADIDESFPVSDTITVLIPCNGVTAKQHKLVEFGEITGDGGNNVSSSIIFRLERLQNSVHDTYDGANEYIIVLDVDYHFPIDAPGSRSEYLK